MVPHTLKEHSYGFGSSNDEGKVELSTVTSSIKTMYQQKCVVFIIIMVSPLPMYWWKDCAKLENIQPVIE